MSHQNPNHPQLNIPRNAHPLPRSHQKPKRGLQGGFSLFVAGLTMAALAFVFTLFTFPGLLI
jgi:hypothetical protein